MTKLKKIAHSYGATLNDVVLSMVSIAVREYLRNHGDTDANTINMLIPFSLRDIPEKKEDHVLENNVTLICFTLFLHSTFDSAIAQI